MIAAFFLSLKMLRMTSFDDTLNALTISRNADEACDVPISADFKLSPNSRTTSAVYSRQKNVNM